MDEKSLLYTFGERLKLVQQMYGIPAKDFGIILGVTSTHIFAITSHKIGASAKIMTMMVNSLGVSLDWMLGMSAIPYTEETISHAEEYLSQKIRKMINTNRDYGEHIHLKRGSMLKEWQNLTLDNRFNMLFLNHFMLAQIMQKVEPEVYLGKKRTAKSSLVSVFKTYSMIVPLLAKDQEIIHKMKVVAYNPDRPLWDLKGLIAKNTEKETESMDELSLFDV